MKSILFHGAGFLVLAFLFCCCSDQHEEISPVNDISWIKTCRFRNEHTSMQSLTNKSDDGFLVAGYIVYYDTNIVHGFVMNMDPNGDTIWGKQIDVEGFTYCSVLFAIQRSSDEILLAGVCDSLSRNQTRYLMWLDANGNIKKQLFLPVIPDQVIWDCKLLLPVSGEIYYACTLTPRTESPMDRSSVRIDVINSEDQIIRSKDYPNSSTTLERMELFEDGKLLLAGSTYSGVSSSNIDMLLLLIDESGDEVYRKELGTDSWDFGNSACPDFEGGYLVAGTVEISSHPALYPVNTLGVEGDLIVFTDTIYSYASIIKRTSPGGYLLIIQSKWRLYFFRLGTDLHIKSVSWLDSNDPSYVYPYVLMDVTRLHNGAFAFLYENETGIVIVKTVPFY